MGVRRLAFRRLLLGGVLVFCLGVGLGQIPAKPATNIAATWQGTLNANRGEIGRAHV